MVVAAALPCSRTCRRSWTLGRDDVPLTELRFRCLQCGADRTDFVVTCAAGEPHPSARHVIAQRVPSMPVGSPGIRRHVDCTVLHRLRCGGVGVPRPPSCVGIPLAGTQGYRPPSPL